MRGLFLFVLLASSASAAGAAGTDWSYAVAAGRPVLTGAGGLFRATCETRSRVMVHLAIDAAARRPGVLTGTTLRFGTVESSGMVLAAYPGYAEGKVYLNTLRLYRWASVPTLSIDMHGRPAGPVTISLAGAGEPASRFLADCQARR